jgi:putative transposase
MGDLAIKRTRNAVYQTAYHAVWIPKYRRRVLLGEIVDRLRGVLREVCQAKGFEALALRWFKGISARTLFAEFPALRAKLRRGHLWAPSFDIGTAGHVSAETIRRYIERTEHIESRR